ncbi:hypothetical protein Tco_0394041 [Tanacetum coccineum]
MNKCLSGKISYDSLRLSQAQILWGMYNNKKVGYAYLLWEDFIYQIENKNIKKGKLTNETSLNSESYKEYYAIASGKIPSKTKASKKKADSDATTKEKPPTVPEEKKGKKSRKGKQKQRLETISEAILTEAEQLKIITKRSRKETHSSHASGSGADEGTGVSPGVPDAPDYDSDDDISWKSSEDDQDEDKNEDDENIQDDDDDAYKLKALEDNFLEFKQTNQYVEALSSIPGIVDQYLENKMKEAVDVAVQLKSDRIREEAQAENQQFLDSLDEE